jgi:hypothetical protein
MPHKKHRKTLDELMDILARDDEADPNAGPPLRGPMNPPPQLEVYYDKVSKYYYMLTGGHYVPMARQDLRGQLVACGWDPAVPKGDVQSPVELEILRILRENHVDFIGALAGHRKGLKTYGDVRCLITSEPKFIVPQPGSWSLLDQLFRQLFGDVQLPYVYGWIKMALAMFTSGVWMPGQAMFIAGPPGAGKNLFAELLRWIFGGRMPGKPYSFMTGQTSFNADFFGAELLTIEDEAASTNIQARRDFGAHIKKIAVNATQWLHGKHKGGLSVIPLWRLLASLNDEPERLLVVPPLDADIEDKIMLLLVEKHPMPMPTGTPAQKDAFMSALVAELPAFLHHLSEWEIPDALRSDRFGVTHYHHPKLADSLRELSPEQSLLELIDEFIFTPPFAGPWCGRSSELARALKNSDNKNCAREAEKLLPAVNSCGRYLRRLAGMCPDRVSSRLLNGNTEWRIEPPADATPRSKPNLVFWTQKLEDEAIKKVDGESAAAS